MQNSLFEKAIKVLPTILTGILAIAFGWSPLILIWAFWFHTLAIVIFSGSRIANLSERFNISTTFVYGPKYAMKSHQKKGYDAGLMHVFSYIIFMLFLFLVLLVGTLFLIVLKKIPFSDLLGLLVTTIILFGTETIQYYDWKKQRFENMDPKVEINNFRKMPLLPVIAIFCLTFMAGLFFNGVISSENVFIPIIVLTLIKVVVELFSNSKSLPVVMH